MENYLNIGLSVALLAFVLFTLYQSIKRHRVCRDKREEFLAKYQDAKIINLTKKWNVFFVGLAVASLVMAVVSQPEQDEILFRLLFVWVAIMSISYMLENEMRRKVYVNNDGFLYDVNYYRFRSVNKFETKRTNAHMFLFDGEDIDLPVAVASTLTEEVENWKQRKKDKKKK